MTEVDLYVDLIDENEANRILSIFHENSKSGNLQFKKTKVRKIFRGMNMKINNVHKTNPFDYIISSNIIPELKPFTESEFFIIMRDFRTDRIENYKKLSNAIVFYPKRTQELISKMEENLKNKKHMFELGYSFKTDEDIEKFMLKTAAYNSDFGFNIYIKNIEDLFSGEDNEKLNELVEVERKWNLLDFYNNFFNNENMDKPYLMQYAYLKTHSDMSKDLKYFFMLDIESVLLKNYTNTFGCAFKGSEEALTDSENTNKLKNCENEIESLKGQAETYKKNIKKVEESNKKLKKRIDELKKAETENEISITKFKDRISDQRKTIEISKETLKNYKQEKSKSEKEKKMMESKLNELKDYEKYNFSSEENYEKTSAVIYSSEVKIAKVVFPEILFIPFDKWKEQIKKENSINKILIKRDGITSPMILEIKNYADKHNISTRILMTLNEKALIEQIAYMKKIGEI